jgi:triacylglycerol lipase
MPQSLATRYPLVLVPGMLGFVRLGFFPYWYGIVPALRAGGAQVFAVQVAPLAWRAVAGADRADS